jgi:uncharacterized protein (UPF0548 family)
VIRSRWVFGRLDPAEAWAELKDLDLNYSADEVTAPAWNFDTHRKRLPAEQPGPPEPGGVWETACRLVRDYEFSPPELVRALYDPAEPFVGRNMLLEARFHGLHFYCGVRVTDEVDETREGGERVWGWSYETLEGHLERGRVDYQVVKHPGSGEVEFVASSYSQGAPSLAWWTTAGWLVFGRRTQFRFYRRCGERLHAFVRAAMRGDFGAEPVMVDGLVLAPSDARAHLLDGVSVHLVAPG